jgi:YggT family protein
MYALPPVASLIVTVLGIYWWVLIAQVVLSWLIAFNVINTRNQFVWRVGDVLNRLTAPVLNPIRRIIPLIGGLDLSPLVLIILIRFLQQLVAWYLPI